MVNMERLRKLRLQNVHSFMKSSELDAIIVNTWDNVRYITDNRPPILIEWYIDGFICFLAKDSEPVVIGYPSDASVQAKFVPAPAQSFFPPLSLIDKWAQIICKLAIEHHVTDGRIGVDYMSFAMSSKIQTFLPRATFVPIFEDLLRVRAVKNPEEIELLREAASIVDIGMTKGLSLFKVGVSEREVYASMIAAILEAGSEGVPWSPILSSGEHSLRTEFVTDYKFRDGDFVPFDIGSIYQGYIGDGARTGLVGNASLEGKNLYRDLYTAFVEGINAMKPGVYAAEIDTKVKSALQELGREVYEHGTGHGIGLRGLELPWIASEQILGSKGMMLEPGMVLAIEPRVQEKGLGLIRLEDMILITDAGHEVLTRTEFLAL